MGNRERYRLTGEPALSQTDDGQASLLHDIDAALAVRGKIGPLSDALRAQIADDVWEARYRLTRWYLARTAVLMIVLAPVNFYLYPHSVVQAIAVHIFQAVFVLSGAILLLRWRRPLFTEGLILTGVITSQAFVVSLLGSWAEEPRALLHQVIYDMIALFTVLYAIVTLRLELRFAAAIAVLCSGIFVAFLMNVPEVRLAEPLCLIAFLVTSIVAATLNRRTHALEETRTALLTLRDEFRLKSLQDTNERLLLLSNTDPLTGIANRRYFDHVMATHWRAARENGASLAVLMLDLDFFKVLNDTQGHMEGDRWLQCVARAIVANCRPTGDLVARYGGEEFIILMEASTEEEAAQAAETLRHAVCHARLAEAAPDTEGVTISVGVAAMMPDHAVFPADLVTAADAALYLAKSSGRNCVRRAAEIVLSDNRNTGFLSAGIVNSLLSDEGDAGIVAIA